MNTTVKQPRSRRRASTVLVYDAKILGKVWKLCPAYVIFLALWSLMWAGIDTAAVYFRNAMFNALDTSEAFMDVAIFILALAVFYVVVFIPDHVYSLIVSPILDNRLRYRMHAELYRKAQRMDLACYDDPDFYNQFVWAMRESDQRAIAVVRALFNVVNRIISATAKSVDAVCKVNCIDATVNYTYTENYEENYTGYTIKSNLAVEGYKHSCAL